MRTHIRNTTTTTTTTIVPSLSVLAADLLQILRLRPWLLPTHVGSPQAALEAAVDGYR